MISIEVNEDADSEWNERLLRSNLGTIYHTPEYASYARTLGRKPYFVKFITDKDKIVGQITLFENSRFEKKNMMATIFRKTPGLKKAVYRWIYGPIILEPEYTDEICNSFREFLLSKNTRINGSEHPLSRELLSRLGKPFQLQTWATFLIDLSQDSDSIWKKLDKHSARKNIERSEKRGVYIKEINSSNLYQYNKMLLETKSKAGINLSESDTRTLWNNLSNVGLTGFIAYENEVPIGGILVSSFNRYVNEWGIARTEKDSSYKLYAQDLLKWKIIEWGIENKFRYYDLTGVNPDSKDEKEQKIFRYKKKFGGDLVKYNLVML